MGTTADNVYDDVRWRYWLMAMRPKTLLTGLAPVLIGGALAASEFGETIMTLSPRQMVLFICCLLVVTLLQAGANIVNDVKDFQKDIDTIRRVGPQRMAQSGLLPVEALQQGYRLCFAAALVIGFGVAAAAGWPLALLGLGCMAMAYLYSGGPRPLSHLGLGELVAFLFFGPVAVMGTSYAVTSHWSGLAALWGVPPGLFAAALMAVNNVRDIDQDAAAKKMTLAVRLGRYRAQQLPLWFVVAGTSWYGVLAWVLDGFTPTIFAALAILSAVVTGAISINIWPRGSNFNGALQRISAYNFLYALIFWLWWQGRLP